MRKSYVMEKFAEYQQSTAHELWQVYKSFSRAKALAFEHCRELCREHDGDGLKIISHNGYVFTAGFVFYENGERKFMYISPSNTAVVELN